MAGELDQTTPAVLARDLAARVVGARFQELEGCGHCPQIEAPQAFVAALGDFL
jgi:pimeloyl-ACP methyl ester carboxylesterase